jgi:hypothetical protein
MDRRVRCVRVSGHGHRCIHRAGHKGPHRAFGTEFTVVAPDRPVVPATAVAASSEPTRAG